MRVKNEEAPAGEPTAGLGPAILFCPGDRPDRFAKAAAAADGIILDLEDAVPAGRKDEARANVAAALERLDPRTTIVRVNPPESDLGQADLEALRGTAVELVMLPKAETPEAIARLAPRRVVAICETARGVLRAEALAAAPGCVAVVWGGEDLTADLGGRSSRGGDGAYLEHVRYARAHVLLAAGAARIAAWDGVHLAISDAGGLEAECDEAVAMGFRAKLAIHPSQVPTIRRAFVPPPEVLDWATELLAASRRAGGGVLTFRGRMVDGPLIAQAEAIVAAARRHL